MRPSLWAPASTYLVQPCRACFCHMGTGINASGGAGIEGFHLAAIDALGIEGIPMRGPGYRLAVWRSDLARRWLFSIPPLRPVIVTLPAIWRGFSYILRGKVISP